MWDLLLLLLRLFGEVPVRGGQLVKGGSWRLDQVLDLAFGSWRLYYELVFGSGHLHALAEVKLEVP